MKPGEWVTVKPKHDIPPIFRDNKPTRGRIHRISDDGPVEIWVPINGADVDENSQSVLYEASSLVVEE